jgi:hypothetical protein
MNVVIAALTLVIIAWLVREWLLARRIGALQRSLDGADAKQKAAVKTSRAVHIGQITEQIAALLPGFPYNPKDVQWVGGTVDAIVWDGLEDGRDVNIVFLDTKTGQAALNHRQRRVKEATDAGRVRFEVYRRDAGVIEEVQATEVPKIGPVIIDSVSVGADGFAFGISTGNSGGQAREPITSL